MDIAEIRRLNMMTLMEGFKKQSDFAEAIDKPPSYISQLKRGVTPKGKEISMGKDVARAIEAALDLPYGWMDVLYVPGTDKQKEISAINEEHVVIGSPSQYPPVKVDYLDMCASCGSGYANEDYPEAFSQFFTVEFLRANGLPTDGKGLMLMHACGDSMGYTIPHGAVILVNTNEAFFDSLISNKIYVFNANGEMICKRVIKNIDGTVTIKSDNSNKEDYPDYQITQENFEHFAMFGRVRYVFTQV